MRKHLALGLLVSCWSVPALAYCGPPRLICAEYAHSDAVVEAKLVRIQHFSPKNDENKQDWYIYTLESTKIHKGTIDGKFRVREENDSGRAGFFWNKGESYLLFLREAKDGTWWLYGCGNSNNLRKASQTIEVINSLSSRDGGSIQGSISGMPLGPNKLKIRVESKDGGQVYEGRASENDFFRIHVPAGRYRVLVSLDGWTFQRDVLMSHEDPANIHIENGWCAQLVFEAKPKSKSARP
jgi:hypothetical protein